MAKVRDGGTVRNKAAYLAVGAEARRSLGVTQSMGRVGFGQAAAESFNSTLEHELLSRRRFETKEQSRREVASVIDVYNHRRRHSSCEMLPPVAYEALLAHGRSDRTTRRIRRQYASDVRRIGDKCDLFRRCG